MFKFCQLFFFVGHSIFKVNIQFNAFGLFTFNFVLALSRIFSFFFVYMCVCLYFLLCASFLSCLSVVCLSVCVSVCHTALLRFFLCRCVWLSIHVFISISFFMLLLLCRYICMSVCLFHCLCVVWPSTHLFVFVFVHMYECSFL